MNDKIKLCTGAELNDRREDLEDIASIFEALNLRFFLIDGVLLGAIREENFIKWDWDVELAIFEEEVMPNATKLLNALFDSGFEIINVNPFSSFFKINIKKRGTKFSLVGLKKSRNSIGGFTFQFSDGWWKFKQTKNLSIHDINSSWANGGYDIDHKEGANNMNEEWFGICAKGVTNDKGMYTSYPRAAYYVLKKIHELNPYKIGTTASTISKYFNNIDISNALLKAKKNK